ncbi:anthranilate phosphoribosyltransferase [Blattabacterium cuenoti]|uniref:anthranilate phosphoribosyltransferase n=1 Tax=Blattabacterium cuenoti TaxID=1653831 RepID=UPI00163C34E7|nr:anthranilate phosphoribosyltransferase [Blattabacterium cuenoti]
MNKILEYLFLGKTLTKYESEKLITELSKGKINEYQISSIISIYNMRNPTVEEILGFKKSIMQLSIKIDLKEFNAVDIVGTGGDGKNTFNISTLACFIVAGTGVKVIKHGNYGSSSIMGSSDLMKELGYVFTNKEDTLKRQLNQFGFCYLHAPLFHPILDRITNIRKKLGIKTIFNSLGPLLNPGFPKNQLLGVNNLELARIYYYIYQNMNNNYAIVHSLDGYDEITLTSAIKYYSSFGESFISLNNLLSISKSKIRINPYELKCGNNIEENKRMFMSILSGNGTFTQNEVALINATFALSLINKKTFEINYEKAKYSLKSGNAKNVLKKLLDK